MPCTSSGNASARLGVGASGDADLKTPGLRIQGVDTPLDAGVGAHGEAFAGVKAGAGARIGAGPNFVGAEGSIGAFAGVVADRTHSRYICPYIHYNSRKTKQKH